MNSKWQISEIDELKIEEIMKKHNINKLLATVLVNRNILKDEEIEIFLNPTRNNFHDPFLILDMEKASNRIIEAINNKENITIYGDYDVDGVTSSTVLKSFLEDRGLHANVYIPNRIEEGYGLNNNAIDKIHQSGCNLMITVDCGISAISEVEYANSKGITTIVTDHHEAGNTIPNAYAVIDNKRKDSTYPFRELAGVGVVFKVIQAIGIKLGLKEEEYLKYLDIVCVGTISDIVPLVDENRVIAKLGLMLIRQTKNLGLRSIINLTGFKQIDSNTISFGVAPRINACGRMSEAKEALDLLLSKDIKEAERLSQNLNDLNKIRQETEKGIYEEAIKQIEEKELDKKNAILLVGKDWHHGVIGIVSSKITENYFKPSILLSFEQGIEIGKGSGRSIPGFDLFEGLSKCIDNIYRYGGHSMAIGISVEKSKLEEFQKSFMKVVDEANIENLVPVINIDSKIELDEISKEIVNSLKILEPFGEANKMPIFAFRNLKIDSIRSLTDGKHLKLSLKYGNSIVNAIGFNKGYLTEEYRLGDKVDIAGNLEMNTFGGVENIQINIKEIMRSI